MLDRLISGETHLSGKEGIKGEEERNLLKDGRGKKEKKKKIKY